MSPRSVSVDFDSKSKNLKVDVSFPKGCPVVPEPYVMSDGNVAVKLKALNNTRSRRPSSQRDDSLSESELRRLEAERERSSENTANLQKRLDELNESAPNSIWNGSEYQEYVAKKELLEEQIEDENKRFRQVHKKITGEDTPSTIGGVITSLFSISNKKTEEEESEDEGQSNYEACLKEEGYLKDDGSYDSEKLVYETTSHVFNIADKVEEDKPFKVVAASNPDYGLRSSLIDLSLDFEDVPCFKPEKIGGQENSFVVKSRRLLELERRAMDVCMANSETYLESLRRQSEDLEESLGDYHPILAGLIDEKESSLQAESEQAVIEEADDRIDNLNSLVTKITNLDNDLADMECDLAEAPRERKQCVRKIEAAAREITKEFNSFTRASIAAQRELANEIWSLEGQMRRATTEDQRLRIEERLDELKVKFQSIVDLQEIFAAGDSTFAFWDQMKAYGIVNNYASVMKNAIELELIVEESYDHDVPSDEKFAGAKRAAEAWEKETYSEVIRPVLIATNRIWTTGNGREAVTAFNRQVESLEGSLQRCRQVTQRSCQQKRRDCRVPLSYCERSVGEGLSIARAQRAKVGSLYSASIRLSRSDAARSRRSGGGIFSRGLEDYGLGGNDYGLDPRGARRGSYGRDPMERLASTSWIPGSSQRPGMPQNYEQNMYCQSQGLEFNPQTNMCAPPKKKFFDGYAYGSANMNMGFRGAAQGQFMGQGNIFAPNYGYGYQPYGYPMMMNQNTNYMYPQMARPIMPGGMPGYGRMPSGMPYGY